MKRCRRCGAENKDENNYCHSCGVRLDSPKPVHVKNKNLIDRLADSSIFLKIIIVVIAVFVFLTLSAWAAHLFFGMPLESYTDGEATSYPSEFNSLDVDGDGGISYYEVQGFAHEFADRNRFDVFDAADKNGDGLLKGAEFDGYIYHLDKYYKDLEKEQKASDEKAKQQKTSSSSKSNPLFEDEGHESCPVCGSEDLSEVPNGWYCNDCGEYLDDDDLYENWWQSQGIKCILPALESHDLGMIS